MLLFEFLVCWAQSQIQIDGRLRYLGLFDSPEEAALAYDASLLYDNYLTQIFDCLLLIALFSSEHLRGKIHKRILLSMA
jgi:capsule polysaccharide export protein KpsE/RkpR